MFKKDGLGEIHMHRKYWSRMVSSIWYRPEGRKTVFKVPPEAWMDFPDMQTPEQAMALIRKYESASSP